MPDSVTRALFYAYLALVLIFLNEGLKNGKISNKYPDSRPLIFFYFAIFFRFIHANARRTWKYWVRAPILL